MSSVDINKAEKSWFNEGIEPGVKQFLSIDSLKILPTNHDRIRACG